MEWDEISFILHGTEDEDHEVVLSFKNEINTRYILGEYIYNNLSIQLAVMQLYGEQKESVALCFKIGDERIDSHAILYNESDTAIQTDRMGSAIQLSEKLPPDFYEWLESMQIKLSSTTH